jgi:cyclopropane fatty-acyl-phospholipid synthase-like methyltransferase
MSHTKKVVDYYTMRDSARADLYPDQPFANYGYWTRTDLTIEQAAEALATLVGATAGLGSTDHVLEVGCGYGACAVVYGKRFAPASIIGIDVTDVRIQKGREYVARHGLSDTIDLRIGDATKLAFEPASFDKVIAVECAFHFGTRRDFLKEAGRVLKPGGLLVMTDLVTRRGTDMTSFRIGDKPAIAHVQLYDPVNAYDADTYAGYLKDAGFGAIRIESIQAFTLDPFVPALHRHADHTRVRENAEGIHLHADRLAQIIEAGEDYVLVAARKGP